MITDTTGNSSCLPAFAQMYHSIWSSNIHLVSVAGLQLNITYSAITVVATEKGKHKELEEVTSKGETSLKKKKKEQSEKQWNPNLEASLSELWSHLGSTRLERTVV